MKELTAVFQSEIFRPVVTLIVPGFYALAAWLVVGWQTHPTLSILSRDHPAASTLVMLLAVITCGLIAENFGSRIEYFFDKCIRKRKGYERHQEEWFEYLRLAFKCEPIGQRYIRTLVLHLKFELGMAVASPSLLIGAIFLRVSAAARGGICALALASLGYFAFEARASHRALSEVRRELLKKYSDNTDDNTAPVSRT